MSEWSFNNDSSLSNTFDQEYGNHDIMVIDQYETMPVHKFNTQVDFAQDIYQYQDPLKYTYKFNFKPFHLDLGNTHFVKPHYVDPYIRKDGTLVEGYFRDGDGNTSIDTTLEQGGGYLRSNPDGNPFNNLG